MRTKTPRAFEPLATLLQDVMKKKKISGFAKVSRDLGMSGPVISRWIQGLTIPSKGQTDKLAKYFDIPVERIIRARQLSRLIHKFPLFKLELLRFHQQRAKLAEQHRPVLVHIEDQDLPLLHPRKLPTRFQKFRVDPNIECGLMGPVWAVCDQLKPVDDGMLTVVLMSHRKIRFDRYDKRLYKGMPAYRVVAILPKE